MKKKYGYDEKNKGQGMGRLSAGWLGWLLGEVADWVMAIWLIAGLAAIIFFLSSNLALCIAVAAAFVGVTLFIYFRIARTMVSPRSLKGHPDR